MSATMAATLLIELDNFVERGACLVDEFDAAFDLRVAVADEILDVFCGLRRTLREAAHLGGDHRKAAPCITGARRLDRGVEREQIGLPCDLVDHADDVGNLAGGLLDAGHGIDHLGDDLAAVFRGLPRAAGRLVGLLRILGVLFDGRGDLFHRRRCLFEARGLLLGTLRQVGRAG